MAKATMIGEAFILTSSLPLEDIKLLQKHRPSALALKDEKAKDEVFRISVNEGGLSAIGEYGITFTSATGEAGLATVTTLIPGHGGDKEYVADVYGIAITNLGKLEESLTEVIASIKAEHEALLDSISVQ